MCPVDGKSCLARPGRTGDEAHRHGRRLSARPSHDAVQLRQFVVPPGKRENVHRQIPGRWRTALLRQSRVGVEDGPLQTEEPIAGVEPVLIDKRRAVSPGGVEGIGAAAAAIEGQHEQAHQALP